MTYGPPPTPGFLVLFRSVGRSYSPSFLTSSSSMYNPVHVVTFISSPACYTPLASSSSEIGAMTIPTNWALRHLTTFTGDATNLKVRINIFKHSFIFTTTWNFEWAKQTNSNQPFPHWLTLFLWINKELAEFRVICSSNGKDDDYVSGSGTTGSIEAISGLPQNVRVEWIGRDE